LQPTVVGATEISEAMLVEMAKKENPSLQGFEAKRQQINVANAQFQERYQSELFSKLYYGRNELVPAVSFAPTFSPTEGYEVGVRKYFSHGVSGSVSTFSDQVTADDLVTRSTATGMRAGIQVDLWKNLWGAFDSVQYDHLDLQRSRSKIQYEIDQRGFELMIRKIYWAMVTNAESSRVTKEMLGTAKAQLKAAEKRLRESVATKAEISRYRAQVSSREAILTALEYEKATLVMQLRRVLPSLKGAQIDLGSYDLDSTIKNVMECTAVIGGKAETPWEFTKYDEVVALLNQEHEKQMASTNRYDMADVNLFANSEYSGRGEEYKGGFEEVGDNGKVAYTVGVNLSVPLGDAKTKSRESKAALEKSMMSAQKDRLMAEAQARHVQMLPMLKLLSSVVSAREQSSKDLEKAISGSQQLYNQARVEIDTLINDQSALLASKIEELKTRQLVINELLSYFEIFTDVPCSLNKRG
jgi:outer membrane protein TolC